MAIKWGICPSVVALCLLKKFNFCEGMERSWGNDLCFSVFEKSFQSCANIYFLQHLISCMWLAHRATSQVGHGNFSSTFGYIWFHAYHFLQDPFCNSIFYWSVVRQTRVFQIPLGPVFDLATNLVICQEFRILCVEGGRNKWSVLSRLICLFLGKRRFWLPGIIFVGLLGGTFFACLLSHGVSCFTRQLRVTFLVEGNTVMVPVSSVLYYNFTSQITDTTNDKCI